MYISCSCFMSKKHNYAPSTFASCNIPNDYALLPVLMPSKRFEYNYALRGSAWKVEEFFFAGENTDCLDLTG